MNPSETKHWSKDRLKVAWAQWTPNQRKVYDKWLRYAIDLDFDEHDRWQLAAAAVIGNYGGSNG